MSRMTASILCGLVATLISVPTLADEVEGIRQVEANLNRAVVEGDVATFQRLLAEEFTHGSHNGRLRTKGEWLEGKRQGESVYEAYDSSHLHIRMAGDAAVVTGVVNARWRDGDRLETGRFRFVRVWMKREGEWRAIAFQATELPVATNTLTPEQLLDLDDPPATREFSIREQRAYLGGQPIEIWGLRCGNALYSQGVAERHVRSLDNMVAHGINCIGVYLQGSNGGHPDPEAGRNGYEADGTLKPDFARRLEWLVREADDRGMVVMVGLFSPRKDQEFQDDAAVQRACEQTAQFLVRRKLRNVFCDIMHEYNHERIDRDIFREPDGAEKKARLASWFGKVAPDIETGVCPTFESGTADEYPEMQVRMIQKDHPIPDSGFVVNVETQRHDAYENDGKFEEDEFPIFLDMFQRYAAAPNACMLFHSGWCQGITNGSGTGPNPEMGGYGTSEDDRGIRFYYEWVRDNVGRYEYPRHVKATD